MPRSFLTRLPAAGFACLLFLVASSPLPGDTKAKPDSFAAVVEAHFSLQRLTQQYAAAFEALGGELRRDSSISSAVV